MTITRDSLAPAGTLELDLFTASLCTALHDMVASKDTSAPLVVIIGITGNQGGSVARALIQSTKPYRIVGLTRDPSKPAAHVFAEKGVELRGVDIAVGNKDGVIKAFEGAEILYVSSIGRRRRR